MLSTSEELQHFDRSRGRDKWAVEISWKTFPSLGRRPLRLCRVPSTEQHVCVSLHTQVRTRLQNGSLKLRVTHSRVMTLLLDRHLYSLCISKILEKNKNILCVLRSQKLLHILLNPAVYPIKTKMNLEDQCSNWQKATIVFI